MAKQYTEWAFEVAIEDGLLSKVGGYKQGNRNAFDQERCLFVQEVLSFIQKTQPKEWEYLTNLQKDKVAETLLDDLCRALNSEHEGCLSVLRHGFKCFGKLFRVAYFASASGINPEIMIFPRFHQLVLTDTKGRALQVIAEFVEVLK